MIDLEEGYDKKGQCFYSNDVGYKVEARILLDKPRMIAGEIYDDQWRPVPIYRHKQTVPGSIQENKTSIQRVGLHTYAAAQALRWQFINTYVNEHHSQVGLATRLVKFSVRGSVESSALWVEESDEDQDVGSRLKDLFIPESVRNGQKPIVEPKPLSNEGIVDVRENKRTRKDRRASSASK